MLSESEHGEMHVVSGRGPSALAERLDSANPRHFKRAAEIMEAGGVVALPFNGIFGLFGDVDNREAADKIIIAKNRPRDRKLIVVADPDHIEEVADLSKVSFAKDNILRLWRSVHALGLILPAADTAPSHLVVREDMDTVLSIWTEYDPLKMTLKQFRKLGRRAFVGTSANKSGQSTHFAFDSLWNDFATNVDAIMEANFDSLPEERRKSTTVLDLTNSHPRLHRLGNVGEEEIKEALKIHNFPDLNILRDIIVVRDPRLDSVKY